MEAYKRLIKINKMTNRFDKLIAELRLQIEDMTNPVYVENCEKLILDIQDTKLLILEEQTEIQSAIDIKLQTDREK